MQVEEIGSVERENGHPFPKKEETIWNEHRLSSFQKIREKELLKLNQERPSHKINPQGYFNYKAREEQIKYELDLSFYCLKLLSGQLVEALSHYGRALNHLKRRGEYEEKLYAVWLKRVKAQENPPTPDIAFINRGIQTNQLV